MQTITLFCIFLFLPIYSLFLYPIIIIFISKAYRQNISININEKYNSFHVLICAFNEENKILNRLKNLESLNYPKHKLIISIISDGSDDNTNNILKDYVPKNHNINIKINSKRQGKSICQNNLIKTMNEEIVLFSDVDVSFDEDVLLHLNNSFRDEDVGCVTGKVIFQDEKNNSISRSKSIFWDSELLIREAESKLGILPTASGSCMAAKRDLLEEIPPDVGEDCVVPLFIINKNLKVAFNSKAITKDPNFKSDTVGEFRSKIRMTSRNLKGTINFFPTFEKSNFIAISISLISRKIFRWFMPFFLTGAFIISLSTNNVMLNYFSYFFIVSILFAIVGYFIFLNKKKFFIFDLFFSFALVNVSFFIGILYYIFSKKITYYDH
tara:strand:+ start:6090 stop:7235 length:1146 start_codon:yes stop_codon:yes gene_type:complete